MAAFDGNQSPFYDDYDEDKQFLKILFRPGYSIQARELTQLQTILQKQIGRFGSHIFRNGSVVTGGQVSLDVASKYLKLQTTYGDVAIDVEDFVGQFITGTPIASGGSGSRAYVIQAATQEGSDPPTLIIRYVSGNTFLQDEAIQIEGESASAQIVDSTDFTGDASTASIERGVFFVNENFALVLKQTAILEKYSNLPSYRIGLLIEENIITENDDSTLLDPANGSYNYTAPGAHRYKFELTLTAKSLDGDDDLTRNADANFFEIMRVESGVITKLNKYPIYSDLEKTFARRTQDESGSYTVKYFPIALTEDRITDSANGIIPGIFVTLEPGKAYVQGFEFETIAPITIRMDKAQDTESVNGYDLTALYGNYSVVNRKEGSFDVDSIPLVDLHSNWHGPTLNVSSVSSFTLGEYITNGNSNGQLVFIDSDAKLLKLRHVANNFALNVGGTVVGSTSGATGTIVSYTAGINSANAYLYDLTKIGTARLRNILWNEGSAGSGSANLYNSMKFDAYLSDIRFTANASFANVKSFIVSGYPQANTIGRADIDTAEGMVSGVPTLFDQTLKSLVYKLPQSTIETFLDDSGATDAQFEFRKYYQGVTFTAGVATITTSTSKERFKDPAGSASLKDEYYTVICRTSGGGFLPGQIIAMDGVGLGGVTRTITIPSVGASSVGQAELDIKNSGANFTADVIATIADNGTLQKSKTLTKCHTKAITSPNTTALSKDMLDVSDVYALKAVYDSGNSGTNAVPPRLVLTSVSGTFTRGELVYTSGTGSTIASGEVVAFYSGNSTVDVVVSQGTFTANETVFGVTSGARGVISTFTTKTNVASRYRLDDGQKEDYYDHGAIILKPGQTAPTGRLLVVFDYFTHSGSGYFTVDSYSSIDYKNIPIFTNPRNGQSSSLRDALDFRPRRQDGSPTGATANNFTLQNAKLPSPSDFTFQADYSYYLPRIDKIVLTKDRKFDIIKGSPSLRPLVPPDIQDAMTFYILKLGAYTFSAKDVEIQYVENKRYTMRDIGTLEKRLNALEYYTALSMLEKEVQTSQIVDENGLEIFKNGILVDSFTGHAVGDVVNEDYKCSVDYEKGELQASFAVSTINMVLDTAKSDGVVQTGPLVTLPFTANSMVDQPLANKLINVNPFNTVNFIGNLTLNPESDIWFTTNTLPDVIVNFEGQNDAWMAITDAATALGTRWNSWQTTWTGTPTTTYGGGVTSQDQFFATDSRGLVGEYRNVTVGRDAVTEQLVSKSRNGTSRTVTSERIEQQLGAKVVDQSVVYSMRSLNVHFLSLGMKPNTTLYPFFDGTPISTYVKPFTGQIQSIYLDGGANSGYYSTNTTITITSDFGNGAQANVTLVGTSITAINIVNAGSGYNTAPTITINSPTGTSATANANVESALDTTLVTDSNGRVEGRFIIPDGKFKTGTRLFRLLDHPGNNTRACSTRAELNFYSQGTTQSKEGAVFSTRVPRVTIDEVTETTTESQVISRQDEVVISSSDAIKQSDIEGTFSINRTPINLSTYSTEEAYDQLADRVYAWLSDQLNRAARDGHNLVADNVTSWKWAVQERRRIINLATSAEQLRRIYLKYYGPGSLNVVPDKRSRGLATTDAGAEPFEDQAVIEIYNKLKNLGYGPTTLIPGIGPDPAVFSSLGLPDYRPSYS